MIELNGERYGPLLTKRSDDDDDDFIVACLNVSTTHVVS